MNFNYQKAYCVLALPAFNNLSDKQKIAFDILYKMVGDRQQNRSLDIPMCEKTNAALEPLSCLEIAELSRVSYFVGHWQPAFIEKPFDNRKGQSWKIANVCDQVLRARLLPCSGLEIYEGKLRVTFGNRNCWLWEEFGLATEENIKVFKECGLYFREDTLQISAEKLKNDIGDLWPDVDNIPANEMYLQYLKAEKAEKVKAEKDRHAKKLKNLKKAVRAAEKELKGFTWMNNKGIDTDNCIYYRHTDVFSFGWRNPISDVEKEKITKIMMEFPYAWEIKNN